MRCVWQRQSISLSKKFEETLSARSKNNEGSTSPKYMKQNISASSNLSARLLVWLPTYLSKNINFRVNSCPFMVNQRKFIVKTSVFSGEKPLKPPRRDFLETIRRNAKSFLFDLFSVCYAEFHLLRIA